MNLLRLLFLRLLAVLRGDETRYQVAPDLAEPTAATRREVTRAARAYRTTPRDLSRAPRPAFPRTHRHHA